MVNSRLHHCRVGWCSSRWNLLCSKFWNVYFVEHVLSCSVVGASLSEPHSYVLTRTFAIRDIYIYIWYPDKSAKDNSANDTSAKPTVRMPTVRKGQQCECQQCECDSGANASSANATAVRKTILRTVQNRALSWDNLIKIFDKRFLSFFTHLLHTRDRRLASEIPLKLSTLVAVDRLTSFDSVRRRCTKALRKQPVRGIEFSASKRTS